MEKAVEEEADQRWQTPGRTRAAGRWHAVWGGHEGDKVYFGWYGPGGAFEQVDGAAGVQNVAYKTKIDAEEALRRASPRARGSSPAPRHR